jgi:hypothetical protein
MKNFLNILVLISITSNFHLEAKEKKKKSEKTACCPNVAWTSKEQCKSDEGDYVQDDKCCEATFLGKKDSPDQVCCGSCTEDATDQGVD